MITGDVLQINLDEGTVFFFFDPFGVETLKGVLGLIQASLTFNPRKVRIVCFHPSPRKLIFDECEWLSLFYRYQELIFIYQSN